MSVWFTQPEDHSFAGLRAGWRIAIFILILLAIAGFVEALTLLARAGAHAAPTGRAAIPTTSPWSMALSEGMLFGVVVLVTWILSRLEQRPWGHYGLPAHRAFTGLFWQGVLWGVVSLSALLGLIFVSGDYSFGHVVLAGSAVPRFGLEWALVFLAVGFFEEFSFRGYLLVTLTDGTGFWTAAIIMSALFGGVHLGNSGESIIGALSAGLIGLFFCFTWRRTGSLWFAVGLHAAWDFCESFVYGVPDSGVSVQGHLLQPSFHGSRWITGGSVGPEGSLWVFLIIILLFALFADLYPARRAPRPIAAPPSGDAAKV